MFGTLLYSQHSLHKMVKQMVTYMYIYAYTHIHTHFHCYAGIVILQFQVGFLKQSLNHNWKQYIYIYIIK